MGCLFSSSRLRSQSGSLSRPSDALAFVVAGACLGVDEAPWSKALARSPWPAAVRSVSPGHRRPAVASDNDVDDDDDIEKGPTPGNPFGVRRVLSRPGGSPSRLARGST